MKKKKPEGIPLEATFIHEGFERNYKLMMGDKYTDPAIKNAVTETLIKKAQDGVNYSNKQSEAASHPHKITEQKAKSIAKTYWEMVRNGEKYGAVKMLAADNNVSTTTINTITKKYKPNSINK
jgi:hypothetical protein